MYHGHFGLIRRSQMFQVQDVDVNKNVAVEQQRIMLAAGWAHTRWPPLQLEYPKASWTVCTVNDGIVGV